MEYIELEALKPVIEEPIEIRRIMEYMHEIEKLQDEHFIKTPLNKRSKLNK
jgi:hypothetical protein